MCSTIAHFFLTPSQNQDTNSLIFNLFVICFTHGRNLEACFLIKNGQYLQTKKYSHHVLDETKKVVLNLIERVSIQFKKDQMWVEQSAWV